MTSAELLVDGFNRIQHVVHSVLDGITQDQLAYRVEADANSISWLIWHLTRVQDDHVADVAGHDQTWVTGGWADRFALPLDRFDTGYGHGPSDVAALGNVTADLLRGYYDAVHADTIDYVTALTDTDLPRIVDRAWDPPVTLSVRLVSVISDDLQHAGQAAYLRGLSTPA